MGKRHTPIEAKLALLSEIRTHKGILFSKFSDKVENQTKEKAWNEVLLKAKSLNICGATKDWTYVRDKIYGLWKSRSLKKRDNSKKTGSKGGKDAQPNEVDTMIYDIIGSESPTLDGLDIPESGDIQDFNDSFRVDDDTSDRDNRIDDSLNSKPVSKRRKLNPSSKLSSAVLMDEKKDIQIQVLKIDLYKKKLETLKLERELHIPPSEFTTGIAPPQTFHIDIYDYSPKSDHNDSVVSDISDHDENSL